MNEKKFCFIICTNDTIYQEECTYYLNHLQVPNGYETDILFITGAESMTSGYHAGMRESDAKYKIYLHQDVFIVNTNFLRDILQVFENKTIGMLGMVGSTKLPEHGIMWYGSRAGRIYSSNVVEAGISVIGEGGLTDVEAVDGLLMATQYDIPWREDIFTGWDFYDVSQSFEFRRQGYRVVVPDMTLPWCIHDDGFLNLGNYHRERRKFLQEYQEDMKKKETKYWEMQRRKQPFLILCGDAFCYHILNEMAYTLADGIRACGYEVEICDFSVDKKQKMMSLVDNCYQAIIGFQSFWSAVYLKERGCYFTDLLHGPKLEMVFDHPFWFADALWNHGKDLHILTHDENYVSFAKSYGQISGSTLIPPGGRLIETAKTERVHDVVFLGTYNNYRSILESLYQCKKDIRLMAARYMRYLRRDVNAPAEQAFEKMLRDYGIQTDEKEFAHMMYQFGNVCQCVMYYYREKIIRTLLDAQIRLEVFGDTWKNSPFAGHPSLVIKEQIAAEESSALFSASKISLNVLAWHKAGCNERLIHSMLAGAAVVSDRSTYIDQHFAEDKELVVFNLSHLELLPQKIWNLLNDEKKCQEIAAAGQKKAAEEYSSVCQAKRVIQYAQQIQLSEE